MTTYIKFQPSNTANFQFNAVLDGVTYALTVNWNLFGQRYYLYCTDLVGNVKFNVPFIASPVSYDINLAAGYFKTPIIYRASTQFIEVG